MKFTDIFIQRPVLASVVSIMILLLGLQAIRNLNVQQYPRADNATVTVVTAYPGANAELMKGFVTTPLEAQIASADGIDYMESISAPSISVINARLQLNYDPYKALSQIQAKVAKVRAELPADSEDPSIDVSIGGGFAAMYLSFYSDILGNNQITDYLTRIAQPRLATIAGVQKAEILGARTFAMRIWLQPERLAAYQLTPSDVAVALRANNFQAAIGKTKSQQIALDLVAETDIRDKAGFENLVLRSDDQAVVRLKDVADVELGAENYDVDVRFNGKAATFVGISVAPGQSTLEVIGRVRKEFAAIQRDLPDGLEADIPFDSTRYIEDSIDEVVKTILEALLIVVVVIFLFLGSLRAVLIPAIAVPLSLVGGCFVMYLLGFSINLLTLLAMVLAIGLVVDDAIIVLENIHRRIEEGETPFDAALHGTRELAGPVIAMTITLIAVYAPIGFIGGITGSLFSEFAFTLAAAVLISGVVALTLSPVMCAKLLKPHSNEQKGFAAWLDKFFGGLQRRYQASVEIQLNSRMWTLLFGLLVLVACGYLFSTAKSELAPTEDQGIVFLRSEAEPYATIERTAKATEQLTELAANTEGVDNFFLINGIDFGGAGASPNTAISGMTFDTWNERTKTADQLKAEIEQKVAAFPELQIGVFQPPALPSPGAFPVEFIITSTDSAEEMFPNVMEIVGAAFQSGKFAFAFPDLKINKPGIRIEVDREKAADLGISMQQLAADMGIMLGGGFVNRFNLDSRGYKVIPQVLDGDRETSEQLNRFYTRSRSGTLVPLSTVITLTPEVQPAMLNRFQQLNSAKVSGALAPGVTLGEALGALEAAAEKLPPGYSVDYAGQSRQYKQEGNKLLMTFFLAIVVIYLVLAAQFESFVDPIIMLVTVPMAISGAMLFVSFPEIYGVDLPITTLNIYTQVGLVTLVGVISKHGILMVEFANQLQLQEGLNRKQAIAKASAIRLRAILMTTVSLVVAMVPLLTAAGPGAESRFSIGIVIAAGMSIGTLFTLYVVPVVYSYLGREFNAGKIDGGDNRVNSENDAPDNQQLLADEADAHSLKPQRS